MEALLKAPQSIIASNQPIFGAEMTSSHPSQAKRSSYFALDSQEFLGMFGPSLADAESSGFVAHFLQASDSMNYEQVNLNFGRTRPVNDPSSATPSYFAYEDADATHELLGLLGPAVADSEVSHYMAHFLP
ncbi:MAG: hypothetical protein U0401_26230 [Anaerolineae bacterium]